ncbi:AraC family transcriptional regulator [Polluticaenibacter yanchengensis]|uniref:AraC family transcriptional regulator n=1 Tax=Polluticaenibacter yanchengensis TaxID=3014562 RepID=A0ABT4UKY6_9BACT|nr:AraC family transcriptional regulator [Chitinophagaceae bacterium LY-5]
MNNGVLAGSHKNIWHGLGRQRIEVPKPIIKSKILNNGFLNQLYVCSLGYYPKAVGHYTYRKKGLPENFLFYCVDGEGWYKINDKKYTVKANEFFILPKNVEHAYGSNETHPWSIYWIHFGGDSLSFFNETNAFVEHFEPMFIKQNSEIIQLYNNIYNSLSQGYSIDNLLFSNMCLGHLLTLFVFQDKHYVERVSYKTSCVDMAISYMKDRINDNISLEEISRANNYSVSRFSNLFKQKTGYAPIDYFIQLKMQKACQELDFTEEPIKNIAYNLGFDDPYYFSRRFSKVIGVSPSKYRSIKKA